MQTLLIDNYDSFTYNLCQLLAVVNGVAPRVVPNDDGAWADLDLDRFDNIVISPGPGHPSRARDFGISARALEQTMLPVLGVCLGHQGICHAFGGRVDRAPEPVHGRRSWIVHREDELFDGIPSPFAAVRYHSLIAYDLPACLERTAWTDTDLCMAVRHRTRPIWGVQFHPESVQTDHGRRIIENFRALTLAHGRGQGRARGPLARPRSACLRSPCLPSTPEAVAAASAAPIMLSPTVTPATATATAPRLRPCVRTIPGLFDPETLFVRLFGGSPYAFWLDSNGAAAGTGRYSFMGDAAGPHAERVTYDVARRRVTVDRAATRAACEEYETREKHETCETHDESIFTYLDRELSRRRIAEACEAGPFIGGYVGYFGYEVKADCGAGGAQPSATPDALFLFADRLVAFDHEAGCLHLIALDDGTQAEATARWLDELSIRIAGLEPADDVADAPEAPDGVAPAVEARHSDERYRQLVARCLEEIRNGESYEICLTNTVTAQVEADPLTIYRRLRRRTAAPYSAFMRFGPLAVLSASPERFLRIDARGGVESKPIKGTARRGATPAEDEALRDELARSEKDRSENLMIVDLLRNDLGAVCVAGSIEVPRLFAVETFATVHQLVSTVRGQLRDDVSAVACVRSAFPGGSMTGAPKKRTVEILDRLEQGPRGIYSGALGYFGLTGEVDLSIVIRTLIATPGRITFGVGGGVVALSTPAGELAEIWLKARALIDALAGGAAGASSCASERNHGSSGVSSTARRH